MYTGSMGQGGGYSWGGGTGYMNALNDNVTAGGNAALAAQTRQYEAQLRQQTEMAQLAAAMQRSQPPPANPFAGLGGVTVSGMNGAAALAGGAAAGMRIPFQPSFQNYVSNVPAPPTPSGPGPMIDTSPIWNQQQIQQQVNAGIGANDATTASRQRNVQESTAGRGFGSSSPLAYALTGQLDAARLATNADIRRTIPWEAAKANRDMLLRSQSANANVYGQRQGEQIQRDSIAAQNARQAQQLNLQYNQLYNQLAAANWAA